MSSEWRTMTLNQAGVILIDCDHKTPKAVDHGQPYIGIPQLKNGRITLEGARLISPEDFSHWRRKALPMPNDVILSRRCNPGETAYVPEGLNIALGQNLVLLRATNENVYPPFLRWLAQGPAWWTQVNNFINVGAVFDSLKCADIPKFLVYLPPYKEQIKISETLCFLDEKIQINECVNQTLEQMAQALFKSWFVNFEPVKAKIAVLEAGGSQEDAMLAAMTSISGKDAASLAVFEREQPENYAELRATAELFPSAMQENELEGIPVGWLCTDLSNLALLNSSSWSKKNAPESLNYVDLANTKWGTIHSTEEFLFSDAPSRARRILKPGDTIVGTVRPGNGSYAFIAEDGLTGSTGFAVLTPKHEHFSSFVYICATSKDNIDRLAHLADGGAYPAVNADVVLSTPCIIPVDHNSRKNLITCFHHYVRDLFSYKHNNIRQNKSLEQLRDTLLPKLLSGEIALPEAEDDVKKSSKTIKEADYV